MVNLDIIEDVLKRQFEKNLELSVGNRLIKRGKFIIYRCSYYDNHYYVELKFENPKKGKLDIVKVPIPYLIEEHEEDGIVYFDYRIDSFIRDPVLYTKFSQTSSRNFPPSKFFDTILEIASYDH